MASRRSQWLIWVILALLVMLGSLEAQEIILLEQTHSPLPASLPDSSQTPADTTASPRLSLASGIERIRARLDAGYHTPPIHPYFRDEQRVINDMRRLVFIADHGAVRGVESVPELVDIAQKMAPAKQTMIIRFAAAGSVANVAAENIMKQIRQRQVNFLRIEVERVQLQKTWHKNHFSLSRNLDRFTYTISQAQLRATYMRSEYAKFTTQHINFAPLPRVSLNYIRWDTVDIFSAIYILGGGYTLISYNYTQQVTLLGWRLQKKRNWAGIFIIKNHLEPTGTWWRCDLWLVL